jgi:hypothetical protein
MISAHDLRERDRIKREARKEVFKTILSKICTKIDMAYTMRRTETTIEVPEFMFGFPAYNHEFATDYTSRQLRRLGYRTSTLGAGKIHVAWGVKKKKKVPKPATGVGLLGPREDDDDLNALANLKKTADALRKKYQHPS